jgi:hypothetical protein
MKLKELNLDNLKFIKKQINENSSIINIFNKDEILFFQTPKMYLKEIVNSKYLIFELINTNSTKEFINDFLDLEKKYSKSINYTITSLINDNTLKIKIPHNKIKIYNNQGILLTIDNLKNNKKKMSCILNSKYIWIYESTATLNLTVEEIMIHEC